MANTTSKYQKIKTIVSDFSWNPFSKYLLNPNSKYGGFALSYHKKIDDALKEKNHELLKILLTTRPDFPELDFIKNVSVKQEIISEIKRSQKGPYYILRPVTKELNITVVEPVSRIQACFRKEPWAEENFPLEYQFAQVLME